MESFRQALGAVYVALAEAAGGDAVLHDANLHSNRRRQQRSDRRSVCSRGYHGLSAIEPAGGGPLDRELLEPNIGSSATRRDFSIATISQTTRSTLATSARDKP